MPLGVAYRRVGVTLPHLCRSRHRQVSLDRQRHGTLLQTGVQHGEEHAPAVAPPEQSSAHVLSVKSLDVSPGDGQLACNHLDRDATFTDRLN